MSANIPCGQLYPVFVSLGRSGQTTKAGFISEGAEVVISPAFDSADWFFDGRAAVRLDGKWGFIDQGGTLVIDPQFVSQTRFSEGVAVCLVDAQERRWVGINACGDRLFEVQHYLVGYFNEGLAWVRTRDERSAYIDRHGELVTDFRFGPVGDFRNGLAPVSVKSRWGFIDLSGQLVIDAKYDSAISSGSDNFLGIVRSGELIGVVNNQGEWLLHPQFVSAMPFREGLAWLQWPDRTSALFDEFGKIQVDLGTKVGGMLRFAEGLCSATPGNNLLAPDGYLDRSGEWVIVPEFKPAGMFRGGRALVQDATGYGYIDRVGSRVWWCEAAIDLPFHICSSWIW